jgi:hypothetical protein
MKVRTVLLLVLMLPAATMAAAQQRSSDTRTWYQAYQDGRRQVQQGNWQAGIASLLAAKRTGPAPGRRIPFYGDVFDDYLPDYYLGIAYLNTGRYKESTDAFEAVRRAGLITAKDKEYTEFTRQSASATSELAKATIAQGPPPNSAVQTSPVQQSPPVQRTPPVNQNAPSNAANVDGPGANPVPGAGQGVPTAGGVVTTPPPIGKPPQTAQTTRLPTPVTRPGTPPGSKSPNTPNPSPGGLGSESAAMAAFFAGDYQRAANLLSALAVSGATPRAEFYLACSRAALVLTGGADPSTLADARARFAQVNVSQFAADQRYISPRVLEVLRTAQP